jgi:hypothetical protein
LPFGISFSANVTAMKKSRVIFLAALIALAAQGCKNGFGNRVKVDAGTFGKLEWFLGSDGQSCTNAHK